MYIHIYILYFYTCKWSTSLLWPISEVHIYAFANSQLDIDFAICIQQCPTRLLWVATPVSWHNTIISAVFGKWIFEDLCCTEKYKRIVFSVRAACTIYLLLCILHKTYTTITHTESCSIRMRVMCAIFESTLRSALSNCSAHTHSHMPQICERATVQCEDIARDAVRGSSHRQSPTILL